MTAPTISVLPTPVIGRLPACFLFLMGMAFTVGHLAFRYDPVESAILLVVLLPLLWLPFMPVVGLADGVAERWFLCALLALAWMASVQALRPGALPVGWWRFAERGAALSICLFVVVRAVAPAVMIRHLGAAAACTLAVATAVNGYCGNLAPMNTASYGFGHINILTNTAGPSLLAWLVYLVVAWKRGRRPSPLDLVLLTVGLACLLFTAIATGRRGVLAEGATVAAVFACAWCWRRWRRPTIVVLIALGVFLLIALSHLLAQPLPSLRAERINLYRAGWDGVCESFPWGYGNYGTLHLQLADGESARHLIATSGWGTHIHNEFLDVLLDGGPVALALFLVLIGLLVYRVSRIGEPAVRLAYQALGVAVLVHLLTDNVYGTEVGQSWCGVVIGMMLAAPLAGPGPRTLGLFSSIRWLAWPFALMSLWGATHSIYPAVIHAEAYPSIHWLCLRQAVDPQRVHGHAFHMLSSSDPPIDATSRGWVIDEAVRKMGWTTTLAAYEVVRTIDAKAPAQTIEARLRLLRFSPFDKKTYEGLAADLDRHPELATLVPPEIQRRLAYLSAKANLPRPNLDLVPDRIEQATDLYAAITWAIASGEPWPRLSEPLRHLCARYGDIPGVTQLAVAAACQAPPGTFPWMPQQAEGFAIGLRYGGLAPLLDQVQTPIQATAIMPLLRRLDPQLFADCEQGRLRLDRSANDATIAWTTAAVRIWGLARRAPAATPDR
jgi:O-antigen ligase